MSHARNLKPFLASNDLAPLPVLQEVRQLLGNASSELDGIDAQIQILQERAHYLQSKIGQCTQILNPVRVIPDDVLREIFIWTVEAGPAPFYPWIIKASRNFQSPLVLTHVCRRWRTIAHSTPTLWCRITIYLPNLSEKRQSRDLMLLDSSSVPRYSEFMVHEAETMQHWLKRSGALPVSIIIHQDIIPSRELQRPPMYDTILASQVEGHLSEMFELIARYLPRCEHLAFHFPARNIFQLFSQHITPEKVANIKHFQPYIADFRDTDSRVLATLVGSALFTTLPSLERLHLSFLMRSVTHSQIQLFTSETWIRLTSLIVEARITIPITALLLENCPSLVMLDLHIDNAGHNRSAMQNHPPASTKSIHMADLQVLNVQLILHRLPRNLGTLSNRAGFPPIALSAPHLQRLKFTAFTHYRQEPQPSVYRNENMWPELFFLIPIVHSTECLREVVIGARLMEEETIRAALKAGGAHITHMVILNEVGTIDRISARRMEQYVENGYDLLSDADTAFQELFTLPGWCSLPVFSSPIPLTQLMTSGINLDELSEASNNLIFPKLQNFEIRGLHFVQPPALLPFIVHRLRLYEHACYTQGTRANPSPSDSKPFLNFTAELLGLKHETDILQRVQQLASAVGVDFNLKVDYRDEIDELNSKLLYRDAALMETHPIYN
ncbi:hypothetical protein CVT24_005664 [Panaeolus cyanescens]|uniref:Uncharacterized protein n=1 Tax=Panaeolus cyanescens TaxID=181874 RepID=A0A409VEF0_9AGAR|nr:hypothetical protein CVT24_005664 [Panaeolus cyanescens]